MKVERIVPLLVQDLIELERTDLVRHQRADDSASAGSDVQIEVVRAEVRKSLVEGGERTDLVHPAHHTTAG
jgi:hypothetical protein